MIWHDGFAGLVEASEDCVKIKIRGDSQFHPAPNGWSVLHPILGRGPETQSLYCLRSR